MGGSELRVVRGDDHWLSPCGGRDCLVIHFGLDKFDMAKVMDDCAAIEECLYPYEVRPHWGKLHAMGVSQSQCTAPHRSIPLVRVVTGSVPGLIDCMCVCAA